MDWLAEFFSLFGPSAPSFFLQAEKNRNPARTPPKAMLPMSCLICINLIDFVCEYSLLQIIDLHLKELIHLVKRSCPCGRSFCGYAPIQTNGFGFSRERNLRSGRKRDHDLERLKI